VGQDLSRARTTSSLFVALYGLLSAVRRDHRTFGRASPLISFFLQLNIPCICISHLSFSSPLCLFASHVYCTCPLESLALPCLACVSSPANVSPACTVSLDTGSDCQLLSPAGHAGPSPRRHGCVTRCPHSFADPSATPSTSYPRHISQTLTTLCRFVVTRLALRCKRNVSNSE